ncbi:MAG: cell wall hydrolase [Caulobacteraceae bacterium]
MAATAVFPATMTRAAPASSNVEINCLAAAVYYEARGESAAGQAAVAQVVVNRTHVAGFPKSVCAVIHQGAGRRGCQFSFACGASLPARRDVAAWTRSRSVAARALSGQLMADVGRAIAFHAVNLGVSRDGGLRRVARIGGHVFLARYIDSAPHPELATGL